MTESSINDSSISGSCMNGSTMNDSRMDNPSLDDSSLDDPSVLAALGFPVSSKMETFEQELPNSQKLHVDLGFGYALNTTKGIYLKPDTEAEAPVHMETIAELLLNGELIHTTQFGGSEIGEAFDAVAPQLLKNEPEDKVRWMRVQCAGSDAELPPWLRTGATRAFESDANKILMTLNDHGNAIRFEEENRGYLVYSPGTNARDKGTWYAWAGNHWKEATVELGESERIFGETIKEEFALWEKRCDAELAYSDSGNKEMMRKFREIKSEFKKHIRLSNSHTGQRAMRQMLEKSSMRVNIRAVSDPSVLAFKNGAVDCKTGEFYPIWRCDSLKERYPLTYIDATYVPNSKPENFNRHLTTIFTDNTTPDLTDAERSRKAKEIKGYFERLLGYMLISGNPEQIFTFWWGEGSNGKSKTLDVISSILGDEHVDAPIVDLMVENRGKPAANTANGLSRRLLTFSELSEEISPRAGDGRISTSVVKTISGEKKTNKFRHMHHDGENVQIVCLPVGITNHLPKFGDGMDYALLRRLVTIPFLHTFSGDEVIRDFDEVLLKERDEIFSQMLDNMLAYLKDGLMPLPDSCHSVQEELLAGYAYNLFVREEYEACDGTGPEDRTSRDVVKMHFIEWCDERGIDVDTSMRICGEDDYGYPLKRRTLTKTETTKLLNAFKICGVREIKCRGVHCLKCRRKV